MPGPDASERERHLSEIRERFDLAIWATGAGLWDWEIDSGRVVFDEHWEAMLGYEPGELVQSAETWESICHPEDFPLSDSLVHRHLSGELDRYECEIRVRRKDGSWMWILDRARVSARDAEGRPTRMTGTQLDITRRKEAELAEARQHGILAGLLDSIPDFIFWKDREGRYLGCNPAVERFLGRPAGAIIGRTGAELFPPDRAEANLREDLSVLAEGRSLSGEDWFFLPEGSRIRVEWTKTALRARDGELIGVAGVCRDVTARRNAEAILEARYRILEHVRGHSSAELLRRAIDVGEELTESSIGFFHFLSATGTSIELQAWSTRTLAAGGPAEPGQGHRGLDGSGIWAECARERRPVVRNEAGPLFPEASPSGHPPLGRLLAVPVTREGRVVGVFGVGAKESDYDSIDILAISQLADLLWEVATGKLADERFRETDLRLRKTLAEKEALLRELFHRTKNSMQLITAMLELKKRDFGEGPHLRAFEDVQGKILAMSLVQEKLYLSGDLDRVDLGEYLGELAGLLQDATTAKPRGLILAVRAESLLVSVESAIPCGIMVSELLANSFAHGYPEGGPGRVELDAGIDAEGMVFIELRDDGVGLPEGMDPRRQAGLGLRTVLGIGEEQLKGRVDFGSGPAGFSCRIAFRDRPAGGREIPAS